MIAPGPDRAPAATVLLVDDDEAVRAAVAICLQAQGYAVLEASSRDDSLRLCAEHPQAIQVAAIDATMPGAESGRLAAALKATRPGLKVLYVSGLPHELLAAQGQGVGGDGFLQKPFRPAQLARTIRELLGA